MVDVFKISQDVCGKNNGIPILYFRKPITTAHACLIDTLLSYLAVDEKFQDKAKQLVKSNTAFLIQMYTILT